MHTYLNTPWSSPSWEPNRFSASQEIPLILWKPKVLLPYSQVPTTCPYPEPVHTPRPHLSVFHLNIILTSTPRSPQWSLSVRFSPAKHCTCLSPQPYALHAPPISFYSILSPEQNWVSSTDHYAPHYIVFSTPLLPQIKIDYFGLSFVSIISLLRSRPYTKTVYNNIRFHT